MTMLAPTPPRQGGATVSPVQQGGVLRHYGVEAAWHPFAIRICREETSDRKETYESESKGFQDLLFSISVMLTDMRKVREAEHPKRVWTMPLNALVALDEANNARHSRDVWFPPAAPRGVPSPPRPIQQRVPHRDLAPVVAFLDEEDALRDWVVCLERKLRDPIERGCVDSWLLITGPQRTDYEEVDAREVLLNEEAAHWDRIAKRFKHLMPAAFFIDLVRAAKEAERREIAADPVRGESAERDEIASEEASEKASLFAWLHEMYGVRLYSTSRVEVSLRCDIEEEEAENNVAVQIIHLCEADYRCSRLALLALHTSPVKPLLVDLVRRCSVPVSLDEEL